MTHPAVVRIFESELDEISRAVLANPNTETGGDLIGLWSHTDSPTVVLSGVTLMLASTAAPEAEAGPTTFQQDPAAHMALERHAWDSYGLQVVGIWHSHHSLGMAQLSAGDVQRTMRYSRTQDRPRYCELLAYISDEHERDRVAIKPHVYDDAASGRSLPTEILVLQGMSPFRQSLLEDDLDPAIEYLKTSGSGRRHRPWGRKPRDKSAHTWELTWNPGAPPLRLSTTDSLVEPSRRPGGLTEALSTGSAEAQPDQSELEPAGPPEASVVEDADHETLLRALERALGVLHRETYEHDQLRVFEDDKAVTLVWDGPNGQIQLLLAVKSGTIRIWSLAHRDAAGSPEEICEPVPLSEAEDALSKEVKRWATELGFLPRVPGQRMR